jgi:hypothetical protein
LLARCNMVGIRRQLRCGAGRKAEARCASWHRTRAGPFRSSGSTAPSSVLRSLWAFVMLPQSDLATAVVVARSDPVLAGALLRGSPAPSLEALRGQVQLKTLARDVLSVSATAKTAAQAEVTANAVADSYIGYIRSPGSLAVRVQEQLLEPALTATGLVPPVQVLIGALLGLVSGALTGVVAALASARQPLCVRG